MLTRNILCLKGPELSWAYVILSHSVWIRIFSGSKKLQKKEKKGEEECWEMLIWEKRHRIQEATPEPYPWAAWSLWNDSSGWLHTEDMFRCVSQSELIFFHPLHVLLPFPIHFYLKKKKKIELIISEGNCSL